MQKKQMPKFFIVCIELGSFKCFLTKESGLGTLGVYSKKLHYKLLIGN